MKRELEKELTLFDTVLLIVGNVVGAGIFTTTGIVAEFAKGAWEVLLPWILGGVLSLLGAMTYGELASMFPFAGGDYIYIKEAYGRLPAFLLGWVDLLVINSGSIAALSLALSKYLGTTGVLSSKLLAGAVVLFLSVLNISGIRKGAKLQNTLSWGIVLFLVGFTFFGIMSCRGSWESFKDLPALRVESIPYLIGPAMMPVIFTYSGWFAPAYVAQEVKKPSKTVPASLLIGTLLITTLYIATNVTYLYAIPMKRLRGTINVGEVAMAMLFGNGLSWLASAFIALAILSSVNSAIITSPRIYYAMSRDGLFFKAAGRVHEAWSTPYIAIAVQMLVSLALIAWGNFKKLLTCVSFIMVLSSMLSSLGVFVLRVRFPEKKRTYSVPWYPYTPALFLVFYGAIAMEVLFKSPRESLLGMGIALTGIPAYVFFERRRE